MSTVESLRAEFDQVGAELTDLIASLPPHVEEHSEPHENGVGMRFEAHRGWTEEEHAQVDGLRARQRELAVNLQRARAEATGAVAE